MAECSPKYATALSADDNQQQSTTQAQGNRFVNIRPELGRGRLCVLGVFLNKYN